MAKKRHWRKRAKIEATEKAKLSENVENNEPKSLNSSETLKDNMKNRKDVSNTNCDEKLLCIREISGEPCLDIECGSNKALLYLSKMCLGSKGACVLFKGSWLTPNEFQFVSGRENAKDWKRSIRHNGSSLKLLFSKNLIKMSSNPKKLDDILEEKENNDHVLPKQPPSEITEKTVSTESSETDSKSSNSLSTEDNHNDTITATSEETESKAEQTDELATESNKETDETCVDKDADLEKTDEENAITETEEATPSVADGANQPEPTLEEVIEPPTEPEPLPEPESDPTVEMATESGVDVQEDDATLDAPAVPVAVKPAKRRKKKAKKRWARQKSKTKSQCSPLFEDLPKEEVPCAYESLTEEDKLAVFVKALRLARKKDLPESDAKVPDSMLNQQDQKTESLKSSDIDDREMPILEKEVDLVVANCAVEHVHPTIFPSTVTPPPTPPLTESPDLDEIKREMKNVDQSLFESRLSPVEEGIKLKINRLADGGAKEGETKTEIMEQLTTTESSHCKAGQLLSPPKEYTCSPYMEKHSFKPANSMLNSFSQKTYGHVISSDLSGMPRNVGGSLKEYKHTIEEHKPQRKSLPFPQRPDPGMLEFHQSNFQTGSPSLKGSVKQENPQLGGVPMVQTPYGPMLLPTEENFRRYHELLAAYSTMQHSISRPQTSEKTQRNYMSNTKTVSNMPHASSQQYSAKAAYQQGKSALFEGTSFHPRNSSFSAHSNQPSKYETVDQKRMDPHSVFYENTARKGIATPSIKCDSMDRKRKYSDCDGALDLSVKKTKAECTVTKVPQQYNYVIDQQDSPIDFSLKKTTYDIPKSFNESNQQNFISPGQKINSARIEQYRTNYTSNTLCNKAATQMDKNCSVPNKQNLSKSAYNSLWYCVTRQLDKDMTKWTVNHVCSFLGCLEGCAEYIQMFRDQGISGKILPFLTTQHLTRTLGMKVGPALSLQYAIGRFFKDNANPNHLSSRTRVSV